MVRRAGMSEWSDRDSKGRRIEGAIVVVSVEVVQA